MEIFLFKMVGMLWHIDKKAWLFKFSRTDDLVWGFEFEFKCPI